MTGHGVEWEDGVFMGGDVGDRLVWRACVTLDVMERQRD